MTQNLSHISLFSGIGGINLACDWAGFTTILNCEIDPFCRKVLTKHWPKVPIIGDIRDVRKENVAYTNDRRLTPNVGEAIPKRENKAEPHPEFGSRGTGRRAILGNSSTEKNNKPVTLITGGFPCQPFSVAGKRRGKDDDRFLWPEMLRVISEFKPTWVIGENVFGIINMALDNVCSDLEAEGYEVQAIVLPACGVNAPHRRYRVFIVAHAFRGRQQQQWGTESNEAALKRDKTVLELRCEDATDTNKQGLQRHRGLQECTQEFLAWKGSKPLKGIWESEPELGRVAHGISHRVDRLRALGNAVVPAQIYPILKGIAEIEANTT